MHILPVLDLLDGVVVRGVGGRRDEYRPVVSRLADGHDALSVARAFRDRLGLTRLYVADLDAILQQRPNRDVYRLLAKEGFELIIDAGLRSVESAAELLESGPAKVVAGLETWPGPDELTRLCEVVGTERAVFSLDLKHGVPLGNLCRWQSDEPLRIASRAVEAGVRELIVLDLASVGGGLGVSTTELCRSLRNLYADLRLITGGGVRDPADIERLAQLGVDGVLVASALHDGAISGDCLRRLAGGKGSTAQHYQESTQRSE
jgi:phosphoribosylformimino-5-aminoimidazole carboxamide ribotide isomerase